MKTNLVVLPSRSRPEKVQIAAQALLEHSRISDIIIAIDDDQSELYPPIEGVRFEVNERLRMNGTLNRVALRYAEQYQTIYFLGDDHVVRTPGWDELLFSSIKARGYGLAYGDDKLQGKNLPTAVMMSSNIIRALGFMAPPELIHLYMDNFWLALGERLDCINYVPEAIIEHMHFSANKSEKDIHYAEVNSSEMYSKDQASFKKYLTERFDADIALLESELGIR